MVIQQQSGPVSIEVCKFLPLADETSQCSECASSFTTCKLSAYIQGTILTDFTVNEQE
jgi:hypothetical protein